MCSPQATRRRVACGLHIRPLPRARVGPQAGRVPYAVVRRRRRLASSSAAEVAAASPSAPAGSGTVSVVTDTGRRYPVASRDLLGRLGYGGVSPRQVPAQLIALLPQGPSLDAARARQPAIAEPGR